MRFDGINTRFFENYLDVFRYFPKAIDNLKSGFYLVKDLYCFDIVAGWFWHPFFMVGLCLIVFFVLPLWSVLVWLALNLILFHPDTRIY